MNGLYESWLTWVIAVFCLIGFGLLLGSDIPNVGTTANTISAIGTLMLGLAALLAFPQWKNQERQRFQAAIAAELHSSLALAQQELDHPTWLYRGAVLLAEGQEDPDEIELYKKRIEEAKRDLEEKVHDLLRILAQEVLPKSVLLGKDFSKKSHSLNHELTMLLSTANWQKLAEGHLDGLSKELNDLLNFLQKKALLEA